MLEPLPADCTAVVMAAHFRITALAQLRQEPSRESPVIAELDQGSLVEREGKKVRRWVPVRHQERCGWVVERVLERIGSGAEPDPVPDPDFDSNRVWSEAEIVRIIREAAYAYRPPGENLIRVGRCESNLDPRGQSSGALGPALLVPLRRLGLDSLC